MARLPVIDSQAVPTGVSGGFQADAAAFPGAIRAGAVASFGAQASEVLMSAARMEIEARREIDLIDASSGAARDMDRAKIETSKLPFAERERAFMEASARIRRQYMTGLDARTATRFGARHASMATAMESSVRHKARIEEIESHRVRLAESNDRLVGVAMGARNTVERDAAVAQIRENIDRGVATGVLTPAAAERMRAASLGQYELHLAGRLIRQDPRAAIAALRDPERFTEIPAAQRARLLEAAERRASAQAAAVRAAVARDVDWAVKQGMAGQPVSDEVWAGLQERARRLGDEDFVNRVAALRRDASAVRDFLRRPLTERLEVLQAHRDAVSAATDIDSARSIAARQAQLAKAMEATGGSGAVREIVKAARDGIAEVEKLGADAPPAVIADVMSKVRAAGDPTLSRRFERALNNIVASAAFAALPPAHREAALAQVRAAIRETRSPEDARDRLRTLRTLERAQEDIERRLSTEPNRSARDRGVVDTQPIWLRGDREVPSVENPAVTERRSAVDSLRLRRWTAEEAARHDGRPAVYFDAQERRAIRDMWASGSSRQRLEDLATLVTAFGDAAPAALAELGEQDPAIAGAGFHLAEGREDTARNIVEGRALWEANKDKARWPAKEIRAAIADRVREMFPVVDGAPLDRDGSATERLTEVAFALEVARRFREGTALADTAGPEGRHIKRALEAAAGGLVTVNGGPVVPPSPDYSRDHMEAVLRRTTPEILEVITGRKPVMTFGGRAQPVGREEFRRAQLVRVGGIGADAEYMILLRGPGGTMAPLGADRAGEELRVRWRDLEAATGLPAGKLLERAARRRRAERLGNPLGVPGLLFPHERWIWGVFGESE